MRNRFPPATLARAIQRVTDPQPDDTPGQRRTAWAILRCARRDRLAGPHHPMGPRPPYAVALPVSGGAA